VAIGSVILTACEKAQSLPLYGSGTSTVLSASSANIAPLPADSNKTALTLNWTAPNHATQPESIKFTIEIDTTGKNFSKPFTRIVSGVLSTSFIAKELNNYLLSRGYAFNVAVDMDIKVTSSYANNNERISSNVLKVKMTPYKVPPKVALQTSLKLFIVGDATAGDWSNPVPVPTQEFARLDETTWGGIFQLNANKSYLLLPVNGSWDNKFSVANNSIAGLNAGGDFGFNLNDNFPSPTTSGLYKIIVDFQQGKFTVTPHTSVLPANLFIVGDATPGDWSNPVPVPSQQFVRLNSSIFELTLALNGNKSYLLLPVNGSWDNKFAVANNSLAGLSAGGAFGYNLNDNFPGPAASGTYKISVNFITGRFAVTQ
jgi:hypothetical protein